jgi:hypothetical protein
MSRDALQTACDTKAGEWPGEGLDGDAVGLSVRSFVTTPKLFSLLAGSVPSFIRSYQIETWRLFSRSTSCWRAMNAACVLSRIPLVCEA